MPQTPNSLASWSFYSNVATPVLLLVVYANVKEGEEWTTADAPFRYIVHRVLDGVQIEYRDSPPIRHPSDRPVTLVIPRISASDLGVLRAIQGGGYTLPIILRSNLVGFPGMTAVILNIDSKAHPGATQFKANVLIRPLIDLSTGA